jgi:hypothetical protein
MRWEGYVAREEEIRSAFKIFIWKNEGEKPHSTHRWKDIIKMNLREIGPEVGEWI